MSSNQSESEICSHTPEDQKTIMTALEEAANTSKSEFDWDTDEINPMNWPLWKRSFHAVLPAIFGLVVFVPSNPHHQLELTQMSQNIRVLDIHLRRRRHHADVPSIPNRCLTPVFALSRRPCLRPRHRRAAQRDSWTDGNILDIHAVVCRFYPRIGLLVELCKPDDMSLSGRSVRKPAFGGGRGHKRGSVVAARPGGNDNAVCAVSVSGTSTGVSTCV